MHAGHVAGSICSELRGFARKSSSASIPRLLHQAWHPPKAGASSAPPRQLAALIARWQASLPHDWRRQFHTAEDARALWSDHAHHLLGLYDAYNLSVHRADASRLLLMHAHGGIYADLDTAPCHNFSLALDALANRSVAPLAPRLLLAARAP